MAIRATIYRGEVRRAIPTHEHPDPAQHLAEDPHGFFKTWSTPHYPYPEQYQGYGAPTVGTHWTRSPQTIPERFIEPVLLNKQPGQVMGKREQTAISRNEWLEGAWEHEPHWGHPDRPAHEKKIQTYRRYVDKAEREGVNIFADLSGHSEDPHRAKPFNMAIVWHGEEPEHFEHGTNYEDELDLPHGSNVKVHGARIYIPRAGMSHDFRAVHPSVFSPEEHLAASLDVQHRSAYSALSRTSSVPWNRIQFPEPLHLPVERPKYWMR